MTDISIKYYKAIIRSESFKPNNPPSLEEPPVVINPPGTTPGGPFEPSFLKGSIVQGVGVTITGILANRLVGIGDVTFNHLDTSSQATITNTNGNVIQSLGFDTFGHVTSGASLDGDFRWVRRHVLIDSSSTWLYTSETGSYPGVHVGHVTTGSSNFPSTLGQFAIFGGHQTNPTSYFARVFGFFRQYDSTNVYVGTANDTGTNNGWALIYTSYNLSLSTLGGINLSSPITGYTIGSNTALGPSDTVLGAFGKVQGQISAINNKVKTYYIDPALLSGVGTIENQVVTYINSNLTISSTLEFSKINIILGTDPTLAGFPYTMPLTLS